MYLQFYIKQNFLKNSNKNSSNIYKLNFLYIINLFINYKSLLIINNKSINLYNLLRYKYKLKERNRKAIYMDIK